MINKALLLVKEKNARCSFIVVDANYISISGPVSSLGTARLGDVEEKLSATVNQIDAELFVCGHHHDCCSRILSSVRKLVNIVNTDLLIVYIDK